MSVVFSEYNCRVMPLPHFSSLYFYMNLHFLYCHSLGDMYHTLIDLRTLCTTESHFVLPTVQSAPAIIITQLYLLHTFAV